MLYLMLLQFLKEILRLFRLNFGQRELLCVLSEEVDGRWIMVVLFDPGLDLEPVVLVPELVLEYIVVGL